MTFPFKPPNFRRPSPRPSMRSRTAGSNFQIRSNTSAQSNPRTSCQNPFYCSKDHFTKGWTHGKANTAARIGVLAVNGGKPLLSNSKKEIVGLPGLFDGYILAELTEEDSFLGTMKRAIISKDISFSNKLGLYMARFWTKAAVINICVVIGNKLAKPEPLRQAVLTRLQCFHPEQEVMMWPPNISDGHF